MHREEGERRVIDLFLGNLHECAHEDPRCRGAAGRKRGGACAGTACCVPSHQRPTAATWEVRTDDASHDAGEQGDGQYHPSGPMYSRPPIADGAVERGDHALAITLVLAHRRDEIPAGGSSHGRKAEHPPARGAKGRGEQVDPERRHQGEAGGEPASGEEHFRHEPPRDRMPMPLRAPGPAARVPARAGNERQSTLPEGPSRSHARWHGRESLRKTSLRVRRPSEPVKPRRERAPTTRSRAHPPFAAPRDLPNERR